MNDDDMAESTGGGRAETLAIACESGGFRCAFVHGALDRLRRASLRVGAIAAASASVLPAAFFAALDADDSPGIDYWHAALEHRLREGNGMSEMILAGIARYAPLVEGRLFAPGVPVLAVAASEVIDAVAAEATQGVLASRLGREQLLAMARGDDAWPRAALRAVLFETRGPATASVTAPDIDVEALTAANLREVAYASTRMLHAWRVPASVGGRAFIDASYTVGFPVAELVRYRPERIVAIATTAGEPHRNLYRREPIASSVDGIDVDVIAPDGDLAELGADYTTASAAGLEAAFAHGREMAGRWLRARPARND